MVTPPFFLQIVDEEGVVVRTRAGGKHEAALVDRLVKHIMPRGVGVLRTAAHVEQDIRDGVAAAILDLKVDNPLDVVDGG